MPTQKRPPHETARRKTTMPYITSEMSVIMRQVAQDLNDENAVQSLHFSPTALTMVRHVMMTSGMIITDTALAMGDINHELVGKLGVSLNCYIDDPQIMDIASQKHTTRAEVAVDHALSLPGLKLIAVGSAPMALNRILQRANTESLSDIVVLAAPTGFANVVQLKERVWESPLASIVVRGKKGGASMAVAIINALMTASVREQNL